MPNLHRNIEKSFTGMACSDFLAAKLTGMLQNIQNTHNTGFSTFEQCYRSGACLMQIQCLSASQSDVETLAKNIAVSSRRSAMPT